MTFSGLFRTEHGVFYQLVICSGFTERVWECTVFGGGSSCPFIFMEQWSKGLRVRWHLSNTSACTWGIESKGMHKNVSYPARGINLSCLFFFFFSPGILLLLMNFIFTKYYLQMKLPCETSFKVSLCLFTCNSTSVDSAVTGEYSPNDVPWAIQGFWVKYFPEESIIAHVVICVSSSAWCTGRAKQMEFNPRHRETKVIK